MNEEKKENNNGLVLEADPNADKIKKETLRENQDLHNLLIHELEFTINEFLCNHSYNFTISDILGILDHIKLRFYDDYMKALREADKIEPGHLYDVFELSKDGNK